MFGFRKSLRRRGTKRGPPLRRPPGRGGSFRMARAALRGVKKLRRQTEVKYVDSAITDAEIPTVASASPFIPLSLVAQGTTDQTRIGVKINPTSYFFRICVLRNTAASNTQYDLVRFVVIRDKDSNGIAPLWSGIGGVMEFVDVLSPLNRQESKRFRVLFDKMFVIKEAARTSWTRKKYIALSGTTTFQGAAATQANAEAGQLYYILVCDTVSNRPKYTQITRFSYRDS